MEDEFPPTDESFVALKYPEYMRIMLNDPHDPYASESESDEDDNSMEEDLVEDEKVTQYFSVYFTKYDTRR